MNTTQATPSRLRSEIVHRILDQFAGSMPIYRDMIAVANDINAQAGEAEAQRLGRIMHAAIRCASDEELSTIARVFHLMGCEPVNYYDLRERVSVESTAFRPITVADIAENGFRVFCSRLSLDCIPAESREFVEEMIARRRIFSDEFLALIEKGELQGGFDQQQADRFVAHCVQIFSRPGESLLSLAEYKRLQAINKVACQILVSNAMAFNHLTPSVASVPAAHEEMLRRGIKTIPVWQGPVGKDVVLRQTSCLAPPITLKFPNGDGTFTESQYQETFVEFEERLQAPTPKGRELFEGMFDNGKQALTLKEGETGFAEHYYEVMRTALADYPEDSLKLWKEQLAYFTFEVAEGAKADSQDFDTLIANGVIRLIPQQYEDFFGPAATNIFNSNIGLEGVSNVGIAKPDSQAAFEAALGREVVNMYDYYDAIQAKSKAEVCRQLGVG